MPNELNLTKNSAGWQKVFENKKAFWAHGGDPSQSHPELIGGYHSNRYFNSRVIIEDETLLDTAAHDLLAIFESRKGDLYEIDAVVGPQTGATNLAEALANNLRSCTGRSCISVSPEKHTDDNNRRSMVFTPEESRSLRGLTVLLCEDFILTSGSVGLTADAVIKAGGRVLHAVLALVNHSGFTETYDGRRITSLIEMHLPTWKPEDCRLCAVGSKIVKNPKDNWGMLKL